MRVGTIRGLLGIALSLMTTAGAAGDDRTAPDNSLEDLTLDQLLDIEVEVVTSAAQPIRETPGVVTVVTRDEILQSGARDLIDVLYLVPGFGFGMDVQGAVALGFRGTPGGGGQVLVLVDGHEYNEPMYGTPLLHFPVALIERIEISRGPGSVIHGSYAELAVIHITTRGAGDATEVMVGGRYGQMDDALGYRDLQLAWRQALPELRGVELGVAAVLGEGRRSDEFYEDFFGNRYRLPNRLDPALVTVGIGAGRFDLHLMVDWLRTTSRDALTVSEPQAVRTDFFGVFVDTRYRWQLTRQITLTPRLSYKRQKPWWVTARDAITYYDKTAERYGGGLTLDWAVRDAVELLVGAEAWTNRARLDDTASAGTGLQQPFGTSNTHHFATLVGYAQLLGEHRWANLSAGVRLEWNSRFGAVVVPRVGVTRAFEHAHVKLLLSQAFRAPGHEPLGLNPRLAPETTTTFELEAGYKIGEYLFVGANAFDITIRDPFVYALDPATMAEGYFNFSKNGSRGAEGTLRVQHPRGRATMTWSFYDTSGKNEVESYRVPGRDDILSGLAAHKVTLDGTVRVTDQLTLSPSAVFIGSVFGPTSYDAATDELLFGREPPTLLLNLFALRTDLAVPGLDVGIGVHDLLDQGIRFLDGTIAHAPLPGPTREYILHTTYRRDL